MYISFAISTLFLTKLRKIYTQFFFVSVTKRYSFYKTCSVSVFGSKTHINEQAFKLTIPPSLYSVPATTLGESAIDLFGDDWNLSLLGLYA